MHRTIVDSVRSILKGSDITRIGEEKLMECLGEIIKSHHGRHRLEHLAENGNATDEPSTFHHPGWTLEEQVEDEFDGDIKKATCWTCSHWQGCPFAFDPFNTDGECFAIRQA